MVNPFTGTGFDMVAMTAAISKLPNLYNRLASVFTGTGIVTTSVAVEQKNGTLNIVRSRPRGAAADKVTADKRTMRSLVIPHLPVTDVLLPEDYQNVRAFGSENAMETQSSILAAKLQKMKNILDQTAEFLRAGALKRIILDADGSTLYNLCTEFAIAGPVAVPTVGSYMTLDFVLDNDSTIVRDKCLAVKRHIEMNLRGESMSGIRCLCSSTFYDALTHHPEVEKAFEAYSALNQNLAEDYRHGFRFSGITFEEYNASWTDHDAVVRAAITADKGICFPEGTGNTFEEVYAPGNFLETANTVGLPYYARQEPKEFNAGLKLWAESNVLPICKRPEVLVEIGI
jgi:hypothetical protein